MNRRLTAWRVALGLAILAAPIPSYAAPKWCALDDPAGADAAPCPDEADAQTLPTTLVLPMPCGRRMVFKQVKFHQRHLLDDKTLYLGGAAGDDADPTAKARQSVTEGGWTGYLAGNFTLPPTPNQTGIDRAFYIASYDVLQPQYELFRRGLLKPGVSEKDDDPTCHDYQAQVVGRIEGRQVLPVTGISWIEAQDFAASYTEWLLAESRARIAAHGDPVVPWEGAAPGYLRLPTEVEWEFAARGGESETDQAHQTARAYRIYDDTRHLVTPGIDDIAVVYGSGETPEGSKVNYAGLRKPNLLGLYDMLGNADQMVMDPFRPVRPDRLGGELGGLVLKGGSALDKAEHVGLGKRREIPFYNVDGIARSPTTSFRLVLSAPVFVNARGENYAEQQNNLTLDTKMNEAYTAILATSGTPGGAARHDAGEQVDAARKAEAAIQAADSRAKAAIGELNAHLTSVSKSAADQLAAAHAAQSELAAADARSRAAVADLTVRLASIKSDLDRSNAAVNEKVRQVHDNEFIAAALTSANIYQVGLRILSARKQLATLVQQIDRMPESAAKHDDLDRASQLRHSSLDLETIIQANFSLYVNLLRDMQMAGPTEVKAIEGQATARFAAPDLAPFERHRRKVAAHLDQAVAMSGNLPPSVLATWLNDVDDTRSDPLRR